MRAHYLQHVPFEGPGSIAPLLNAAGWELSATMIYKNEKLPDPSGLDLLVIMGGPMSVNDESLHPWLQAEKALIRSCLAREVPMLGICLGAQLLAAAAGAAVYRNHQPEIGWFPVQAETASDPGLYRFPSEFMAFHWHGETFDLPAEATLLASTGACRNQAFQLGRKVIGLQFHLETTAATARDLVRNCSDELVPAPFVQSAETIINAPASHYRELEAEMSRLLSFLTARE